jgi:ribose transport system permease protein
LTLEQLKTATEPQTPVPDAVRPARPWTDPREFTVYISFVAIFAVLAVTLSDDGFLTETNLLNILTQAAPISIMAIATVFVLSSGEIDLSIGSVVALSALVTAVVMRDASVPLALAAGLGTGVVVGLFNGLVVTVLRIPSFLATLASLAIVAGLARSITDLQAVAVLDPWYTTTFGSGKIGPFSTMIVWSLAIVILGQLVYWHRRFGAHVRAVGDDRAAAASAGINVNRTRIKVLVLSAVAAALAGMLLAGRLQSARYTLGENDLLTVIAAVIIGGTSLFGGRGTVLGALVGSLLLAMLNNGLILYGLSVSDQSIALGIIIIVAVAFRPRAA